MRRGTMRGMALALLLPVACAAGCQTIPATGERQPMFFSREDDVKLGRQAAPEFEEEFGGPVEHSGLQGYVRSVGRKVARKADRIEERRAGEPLPYEMEYTVLDSKVINAFALPGGPVYITRGLLKEMETEAQLAAVLAHETGHVYARHGSAQLSRQLGWELLISVAVAAAGGGEGAVAGGDVARVVGGLANLKYSRTQENQADSLGLDYMVDAGYDPDGMPKLLQVFSEMGGARPPQVLSTHPHPEARIGTVRSAIRSRGYADLGGEVGRSAYRRQVLDVLETLPPPPEPKAGEAEDEAGEGEEE